MCMQDLAISQRVTWRPINLADAPGTGSAVLPPSPLRVAVAGRLAGSSQCVVWRLAAGPDAPQLNAEYDASTSVVIVLPVLTTSDIPGCFNGPLYADQSSAVIQVWEAVIDSDLSMAVQALNREISQRGG